MLLVDEFLRKMHHTSSNILAKQPDRIVSSGISAIAQATHRGEKIYFSPSTMLMLADRLQRYDETIEEIQQYLHLHPEYDPVQRVQERLQGASSQFDGAWIEFDKPIALPVPIAAMLYFMPSRYLDTGKDKVLLHLIDQFAEVHYVLSCIPGDAWEFEEPFHRCTKCQKEYGVTIYCQQCKSILATWSHIFAMSAIIAGQYLAAMRYEEKAFTGVRRIQRQHSHKERRMPVKHIFKVIDANEIIIPVSPDEPEREREVRGPWLADALAVGNVEYQERQTRPFVRTYRHERYKNVRGQSIAFPEGIKRMQPRLKSNIGKHVTKVKASDYEPQNQ